MKLASATDLAISLAIKAKTIMVTKTCPVRLILEKVS